MSYPARAEKIFAMVTDQGTAASETALCDDCFSVTSYYAEQRAEPDVDQSQGFKDCSENQDLICSSCGKPGPFYHDQNEPEVAQ